MQNLFDLTGKKALVTGGSKGIGNRLARGLHDAGAEVVIFYNSTYSEQMAQEMQGDGPGGLCHSVQRGGPRLPWTPPWRRPQKSWADGLIFSSMPPASTAATGWKTSPGYVG